MKYRRDEAFRYEFSNSIECTFKSVSGLSTEIHAVGKLLDVSPSGMKLFTTVDIPFKKNVILFFQFTLNDLPLNVSAEIIWKRDVGNGFHYGLKQLVTKEEMATLVAELKLYVKNKKS